MYGYYSIQSLGLRCNSGGWTEFVQNITYDWAFDEGNFPDLTAVNSYQLNAAASFVENMGVIIQGIR
jgi:hypothetical protein